MNRDLRRRLWVTPILLLLALWFQQAHWDWLVVDSFFDYDDSRFPMRGLWWSDALLHEGGTMGVTIIGVAALIGALASYRLRRLEPYRGDMAYLFACIALTTGIVAAIKSISGIHCPLELARYGGHFQYETLIEHLFRPLPGQPGKAGACFPGGHSSGGLSMLAFYFLALHHRKAYASRVLMAAVTVGLVFGLTQWIRGAHFPSHDLSTAAIAWSVCALLAALRRPRLPASRQAQYDARTGAVVLDLAAAVVQQGHRTNQ